MAERKRAIQLKLWVDENEKNLIEEKMKILGTHNFGAYARKMLIDGYIIKVDYSEQRKLAAEVNKIGININQICKQLTALTAFIPKMSRSCETRFGNCFSKPWKRPNINPRPQERTGDVLQKTAHHFFGSAL